MVDYRSRLIAARERLGLSRSEMAARLLTPIGTYKQWEDGSRRTPGVAVIAAEGLQNGRPKINWAAMLSDAVTRDMCASDLAKQMRVSEAAISMAQKRFGIELPRKQGRRS